MIRLIEELKQNEAALVCTCVNRRYLTNFPSSLGYLLVCKNQQILLVDGRYFEAAQKTVKNAKVFLLKNIADQLKSFVLENNIDNLLIEDEISHGTALLLRDACGCKTQGGRLSSLLLLMRSTKSRQEINTVVSAQRIAENALTELLNFIKPGVSEKRLVAELEYQMRLFGADGASFDTIVISGEKTSMPHGVPTSRIINEGEFVMFDFGALIDGYHSDMTRTVAVKYATEQMREIYSVVLEAELAAEHTVRKGVLCADVDAAARAVINNAGYGEFFSHSTGHGVGLEIHERPNLSAKSDAVLKTGNLITCEPGIYLPGKFGVRTEDMLYIGENGPENLTKFEKQLIIV